MTIDFAEIAKQIKNAVPTIRQEQQDSLNAFNEAKSLFLSKILNYDALISRITNAKTTFLIGIPRESLTNVYSALTDIKDYTVFATDGSQIDLDRNQSIPHYLLNISKIRLSYGDNYGADIDNECAFNITRANMVISDEGNERPLNSVILAIMRSVDEMRVLTELCEKNTRNDLTLALSDGTLIMWTLSSKELEDWIVRKFLDKEYLSYLNRLHELYKLRGTLTASYISFPGSSDVVNILRLIKCPFADANCDSNCPVGTDRVCDCLVGVNDRMLFNALLKDGERSAIFQSQSSILNRYGENVVCFFYLKVGDEIGRVEIPRWIAEDLDAVDKLHAILLSQCKKGNGYPVALSEAHEAAVVTNKDAQIIRELMRQELADNNIDYNLSAKAKSKIRREI